MDDMNPKNTTMVTFSLSTIIEEYFDAYLKAHEMEACKGQLFKIVMHQVEKPLITLILKETAGNQCRTAEILGINRNTLRKKINEHNIL